VIHGHLPFAIGVIVRAFGLSGGCTLVENCNGCSHNAANEQSGEIDGTELHRGALEFVEACRVLRCRRTWQSSRFKYGLKHEKT